MSPNVDAFDHERHIEHACELAREAAARGDRPFGSVLVRDNEIVAEATNRVNTEDDIRRHPELDLAREAARSFSVDERLRTVMYTSTEPCPMCCGGLRYAQLRRVVFSTSAAESAQYTGSPKPDVEAVDILGGTTEVVGPVAPALGRAVHEAYDWEES